MVDGRTTTVHAYIISSPKLKIGPTLNIFHDLEFFFSSPKFTQYTSEDFFKLSRNKHCFEHFGGYAQQNQQIDLSEDQIRRVFDDK